MDKIDLKEQLLAVELSKPELLKGDTKKTVLVNQYERNPKANVNI